MSDQVWSGGERLRGLLVEIASLEPWPGNPRRGDVPAIRASLRRFGQVRPIVARGPRIVAGHHVVLAALEEGWTHIAALDHEFVDEEEARAFLLADNRTGELGRVDDELLEAQLKALSSYEGIGYSDKDRRELEARLAVFRAGLQPVDLDDAPPLPVKPVSVPGEVYELGPHRLLCGDAKNAEDVGLLVGDQIVDAVWTDPPYGVAYVGSGRAAAEGTERQRITNDDLTDDALEALLRSSLTSSFEYCRRGGSWYVAAPPGPRGYLFEAVLRELGVWRQSIAWVKDHFVMGRSDYHGRHETIYYGWKPGAKHTWNGGRKQDTVWEIPRPKASAEHPTMKPVELIQRSLVNSTNAGETVLDLFAGSGSTLIAAELVGLRAFLMELDPAYCDVVRKRYADYIGRD